MFDMLDRPDTTGDTARLDAMRLNHAASATLDVERLHLVLDWALTHPGTGSTNVLDHDDHPGGPGTPTVAAFTAESLAHAYATTPAAAASELADTLDLRFRFPRLWDQIDALLVPVWKARRIARQTRHLSQDAAGWVDRQLLGHAASLGTAALDRLVATACARIDPDTQHTTEETARASWDVTLTSPRHDPPPRMATQVVLNQPRCAFPGCTHPARTCDLDHCIPWHPDTDLTRPDNLAPLCRRHHRAKTAGRWTYHCLDHGYLWTGPQHQQALVTPDGTLWIPPPDDPP